MKLKQLAKVGFFCLIIATVFGCTPGRYSGGGYISSTASESKKATFGFNFQALDRDGDGVVDIVFDEVEENGFYVWWLGKGQFQFNDQAAGVKFHCDVDETTTVNSNLDFPDGVAAIIDEDLFNNTGEIEFWGIGLYSDYKSALGSGHCQVVFTAAGDDTINDNDTIDVSVYDGPYAGYHNSGTIKGGNITWHPTG